jgi:hypothetical protein
MLHPLWAIPSSPSNEATPNSERPPRPKLPRIPEEMRQWSCLLVREILGLPDRRFAADVRHDGRLPRECHLWRAAAHAALWILHTRSASRLVAESEPEETAREADPYPAKSPDANVYLEAARDRRSRAACPPPVVWHVPGGALMPFAQGKSQPGLFDCHRLSLLFSKVQKGVKCPYRRECPAVSPTNRSSSHEGYLWVPRFGAAASHVIGAVAKSAFVPAGYESTAAAAATT